MNSIADTYELHNGIKIPCIGYGTCAVLDGEDTLEGVKNAIKTGYRNIDTAAAYQNERSVGGSDPIPLPKSIHVERMVSNTEIFDFELTARDMDVIDHIPYCGGYMFDPDTAQF